MEDDLPPPYSPVTGGGASGSTVDAAHVSPDLYTAHLASHLSTLPARIRANQAEQVTQQARYDLDLVTLLVPHVEAFLSDLAGAASPLGPARPAAELTLVPERAVPRAWSLAGAKERQREGEVVQLVRVVPPGPEKGRRDSGAGAGAWDAKQAGVGPQATPSSSSLRECVGATFDEWGRWDDDPGAGSDGYGADLSSLWWWRDEAAARRLAAYLQPRQAVPVERREVQAAVERAREEKKSKGWGMGLGWGRKASVGSASRGGSGSGARMSPSPSLSPSPAQAPQEARARERGDGRVAMTVRPEEVTFRRENEFGVWESMSGWGIVVTVRIRRP